MKEMSRRVMLKMKDGYIILDTHSWCIKEGAVSIDKLIFGDKYGIALQSGTYELILSDFEPFAIRDDD